MPRLILLRHGQSQWNLDNRFTGWVDVDLTAEGEAQARRAGEQIAAAGFRPSVMFTSVLKRATRTGALALDSAGLKDVPVIHDWRLNERHYGGLTGLNKAETTATHGEAQVLVLDAALAAGGRAPSRGTEARPRRLRPGICL